MKIAFVWPWEHAKKYNHIVQDGLMTAMDIIFKKKHTVDWYLAGDKPDDSYDWILVWGVGSLPFNNDIERYSAKKALMCAGHPRDVANIKKFNCVFVESPLVYKKMKPHCNRIKLAFGCDTDFFKPLDIPKYIDAVYPATFSQWKRQTLFADAVGENGLCFGTVQPDGEMLYDYCLDNKVSALNGLMPHSMMNVMYNSAKTTVITAWHGSERTVIESLACNVPVVITKDNELACSLLPDKGVVKVGADAESIRDGFEKALTFEDVNTRDYILENYTAKGYAEKILAVIESG